MSTEQLTLHQADHLMAMAPMERIEEACCWINAHKSTWYKLRQLVDTLGHDKETDCLRRGDLYILAQQHGWSITLARELRFDNNFWSVLARLMIFQCPTRARIIHITKRDTNKDGTIGIDALDIPSIYRKVCHDYITPMLLRNEFRQIVWPEKGR